MQNREYKEDTIEADPRARRRAAIVLVAAALFGSLLIYLIGALEGPIALWLEENISLLIAQPWLVFLAAAIVVAPVFWGGLYLYKYGRAVVIHQQLPAPGYGVVRRMRVQRGSSAVTSGRLIKAAALFIMLSAGLIPVFLTSIFVLLINLD